MQRLVICILSAEGMGRVAAVPPMTTVKGLYPVLMKHRLIFRPIKKEKKKHHKVSCKSVTAAQISCIYTQNRKRENAVHLTPEPR